MFRIKNKDGQYFKKMKSSEYEVRNGQYYKVSVWDNKGKILMDEKELNRALNKLTTVTPALRGAHDAYPTYRREDLIIEEI